MVKSALTWLSTTVLHLRNFLSRFLPLHSPPVSLSRPSHSRDAFIVSSLPSIFFLRATRPPAIQIVRYEDPEIFQDLRNFGSRRSEISKSRTAKVAKWVFFSSFFSDKLARLCRVVGIDALADFQILSACANRVKASACRKCRMKLNRLAHQQFRSLVDYVRTLGMRSRARVLQNKQRGTAG